MFASFHNFSPRPFFQLAFLLAKDYSLFETIQRVDVVSKERAIARTSALFGEACARVRDDQEDRVFLLTLDEDFTTEMNIYKQTLKASQMSKIHIVNVVDVLEKISSQKT